MEKERVVLGSAARDELRKILADENADEIERFRVVHGLHGKIKSSPLLNLLDALKVPKCVRHKRIMETMISQFKLRLGAAVRNRKICDELLQAVAEFDVEELFELLCDVVTKSEDSEFRDRFFAQISATHFATHKVMPEDLRRRMWEAHPDRFLECAEKQVTSWARAAKDSVKYETMIEFGSGLHKASAALAEIRHSAQSDKPLQTLMRLGGSANLLDHMIGKIVCVAQASRSRVRWVGHALSQVVYFANRENVVNQKILHDAVLLIDTVNQDLRRGKDLLKFDEASPESLCSLFLIFGGYYLQWFLFFAIADHISRIGSKADDRIDLLIPLVQCAKFGAHVQSFLEDPQIASSRQRERDARELITTLLEWHEAESSLEENDLTTAYDCKMILLAYFLRALKHAQFTVVQRAAQVVKPTAEDVDFFFMVVFLLRALPRTSEPERFAVLCLDLFTPHLATAQIRVLALEVLVLFAARLGRNEKQLREACSEHTRNDTTKKKRVFSTDKHDESQLWHRLAKMPPLA